MCICGNWINSEKENDLLIFVESVLAMMEQAERYLRDTISGVFFPLKPSLLQPCFEVKFEMP